MGMNQQFRTTTSWDQAIDLLDHSFPLAKGSHSTASAYLCYFDHLLVIQNDGSATGLKYPSQFVEASGIEDAPCCILLENNGLQVEIEPGRQCSVQGNTLAGHRMQLLTTHISAIQPQ
jgi:malate synthase